MCSHMRWMEGDFSWVKRLTEFGLSDYQIARLTGVPRSTVLRWRRRDTPPRGRETPAAAAWRIVNSRAYVYLLGCYLGDGHITLKPPQCWTLRISCDRRYPKIIDEL